MADDWLSELNPPQRQAATFGDGPVLVIAGAGTGKTKTLASRVAYLIEQGQAPDRILLLTFTRRASAQMISRAGHLVGATAAAKVWGGTFHATANRLLRQYGQAIGLAPQFTVVDQSDAEDMMNLIRGDLGLGKGKRRFPRKTTLMSAYSRMVNSQLKLAEVLSRFYPWCEEEADGMRQIYEIYTQRKREQLILDYDDLLLYWRALCHAPGVGDTVADRFDHILVDEYQDTNLIQAEILQGMRKAHRNIMVVGDDAQSIYSFRAATVRNILDFPQQFEGDEQITLEQNYRSTQPILDASNAVMRHAKQRYTKNLFSKMPSDRKPRVVTCFDEPEQCEQVCERVLARLEEGTPLREQAVLFRAGHHSDQLEVELTRRNIPFVKYGGLKFVESAHIKDMLAILRLLENPSDELSWYRVLLLLEGIGPVSARRIIAALQGTRATPDDQPPDEEAHVQEEGDDAPAAESSPLRRLLEADLPVPGAARREFDAFKQAIADCTGAPGSQARLIPASQIERIRRFYDPIFERIYDNPVVRKRDLEQLEQIAANYKSRRQFITDLTLDPPNSTQDLAGPPLLDEDFLILSTIHSAKGCEWDAVYIIHVADGMMPSDMATGSEDEIEEERRLLYVAMTRARKALELFFPLRYYWRGRRRSDHHNYAQFTRFIPEGDMTFYDRQSAHRVAEMEKPIEVDPNRPSGSVDIESMLKDLLGD